MENGTYVLLSGIDPHMKGAFLDFPRIISVIEGDDAFQYIDSLFPIHHNDKERYLTEDGFICLYSNKTSDDTSEMDILVDSMRLFKLSSLGAGLVLIVNDGTCVVHRRYMETYNEETMRLPAFSFIGNEMSRFEIFFKRMSKRYKDPEWSGTLPELMDFYREAYRIDNPQTAFMNLIVILEIYRRWADEYMDRFPNSKDVISTDIETKGKNGRVSGTKRVAVLVSRLLSDGDEETYTDTKRLISQLYYQRNDYIHGGVQIMDICHRMIFDVVRCIMGRMVSCQCSKDELLKMVMSNKVHTEIHDEFHISKDKIEDFIMSFDR
jgi:hypothetical protein